MTQITIVIPIYQVEQYLPACLDSIVAQTFKDFICILVDDGTKDRCNEIADEYAAVYPQIFTTVHQKNMGLSGARNTGIAMAKSKYIMFLDSDDVAEPDFCKALYEAIERYDADIVECGFVEFYPDGREVRVHPVLKGSYQVHENPMCMMNFTITAWNKIYKRSLFDDVRYPLGLIYEDTGTTPLLMARSERVASISDCLVRYRQRENSIMASLDKRIFQLYNIATGLIEDQEFSKFPEIQEAHVMLRMKSLVSKLCQSDADDQEIRDVYNWLRQWNPRWNQNEIWKNGNSRSLKLRIFRWLFSTGNPTILRKMFKRGK